MQVFSFEFFGFFIVALLILTFMARRKRKGPAIVQGKQISFTGQKLITPITAQTPLNCLLDEGKTYGEDFKDKTPPQLPHCEGCQCKLEISVNRSRDWFDEKSKKSGEEIDTDLGKLSRNEYRFYKYAILSNHPDADDSVRSDFEDLMNNVSVSDQFKDRVRNQLKNQG